MAAFINFCPPVIAHRGASGYAPENTMAAFIKAAQLGIEWVEFDVILTACNEIILFHDEELDRVTSEKGSIDDHPFSYLQTLDVGSWFHTSFANERIPTLIQVLEFLKSNNMKANIEIKTLSRRPEEAVTRIIEKVSPYLKTQNPTILFSSFSITTLEFLRNYMPDCLIGLLLHEWLSDWSYLATALKCVSVHVNEEIMTFEMAQKIKDMDKVLLCYTVNDPKRAEELFSWGVDAVFSDYPDLITKKI